MKTVTWSRGGGREGLPDRAVEEKGRGAGVLEADGGETQQEAFREVSRDPELSNVSVGSEGPTNLNFEINLCVNPCV